MDKRNRATGTADVVSTCTGGEQIYRECFSTREQFSLRNTIFICLAQQRGTL
jgi:hypothetical protein